VSDSGEVSENESIWKLGDHKGQTSIELAYNNDKIKTVIYAMSVFEDSSGSNIFTNRDLNLGFFLKIKECKIINSFMYEHFSTTYQSGIRPQPHKKLVETHPWLGPDWNFNHSIYTSGWTNRGRMIGMPLMLSGKTRKSGIINSAIKAHHFGFKGEIKKFTYKLLYTYSENYGNTYLGKKGDEYIQAYTYEKPLKQQSICLEVMLPKLNIPFDISTNVAYDFGDLLPNNNFGFQLKISKSNFL
jgi:hypothetical protein